jgi:hypothetical protein
VLPAKQPLAESKEYEYRRLVKHGREMQKQFYRQAWTIYMEPSNERSLVTGFMLQILGRYVYLVSFSELKIVSKTPSSPLLPLHHPYTP